jgi:unsaturated rhamnogalacturonyl hydrolase
MLGDVFEMYGVQKKTLFAAPNAQNLKGASIYVVVDPDTNKETEKPNYINAAHANTIAAWVKGGGVLIIMGNDAGNTDLNGLNILGKKFGITFNNDNYNLVEGSKFEQGNVLIPRNHSIFKTAQKLYVKELATINTNKPASTILTKEGKNIIAVAKYGKGAVFAIGDPWLYNEYIDGRKLPADFDNYKATHDLVKWAIKQSKK